MSESIFMRIEGEGKEIALSQSVRDLFVGKPNPVLHTLRVAGLSRIPLAPFAYWVGEGVRHLFATLPPFEGEGRTVKQGLATADDFRFVRAMWETPSALASESTRTWFSFAKGGSYSPFYADVFLKVNWGRSGAEIRFLGDPNGIKLLSRPQNISFYSKPGLTWPLRTQSGLAFRALPAGCVFGHKGPCAFLESDASDDLLALLALTTSQPFRGLVEIQMAFGSYEVGVIQRTVVPSKFAPRLAELALAAWTAKRRPDTANLTSHAFLRPALAQPGSSLAEGSDRWSLIVIESSAAVSAARSEIDSIAYRLYRLGDEDRRAIEKTVGSTESSAKISAGSGEDDGEDDDSPAAGASGPALVSELLDYALGCAFGRWDIRYATGDRPAPELPDPFAPLPVCPPGMLQGDNGLPLGKEELPTDYPLRITWPGILVDDPGHPEHDIVSRLQEVLGQLFPERPDAIEQEACEMLDVKSLRDWLRKPVGFFADHLKRYSKSRRQAPIYWPLSSPKGLYTIWIYYHRLNADTLFTAVRDFLEPKLQYEEQRAFQLKQEAGPTPSPSQRQDLIEADGLVDDLRALKDELNRVAPLFRPNLNDGVILNCAPLWRMMPLPKWQKDCKAAWDSLSKGDYDWAHLSLHLWPERVIPKCATDRSLAIAHGLEDTFWEITPEDELPKKQQGKDTTVWRSRTIPAPDLQSLITTHTSPAIKAALEELAKAPVAGGAQKGRKKGISS
jgi:hypothetical protein